MADKIVIEEEFLNEDGFTVETFAEMTDGKGDEDDELHE